MPFIETTLQDVRYGVRGFARHLAFSLVAVATLAVGIGAVTVVFAFTRAVLLRALPYRSPAELVRIYETNPLKNWTKNIAAPANWADWRARNSVFADIGAYEQFNEIGSGATEVFLTGFGEPQGLKALGVTGNLLSILGTPPLIGRVFTDDETYEGKSRVAVLSYGLWQSAFGGDPRIVGRTISLSGRTFDVVGVMPRSFFFPGRDVQLWMPVGYTHERIATSRRPHWLGVVARLRPRVTIEQASQDMATIAKQLESEYPDTNTQMGVRLEPLHESFAGDHRTSLYVLSAAVALLFLIVCSNLASLQLGRGLARSREFAVRRALGADRTRLLRQLGTEALLLSAAGASAGAVLATVMHKVLTRYAASALPLYADVSIDRPVLLFAVVMSLLGAVVFGVAPAFALSRSLHGNERVESASRETLTLRGLLVAGEVALSVILVIGAVLLIRSLAQIYQVDPGFNANNAVAFTVTLPSARYPEAPARLRAVTEIERRLAELPGTVAVGATSTLALRGFTWTGDSTIEGRAPTDYERETRHASTSVGYFASMGIRLVAGRPFAETDTPNSQEVTVVNETLARRYFRGTPVEQVVGRRLTFGRPQDNGPWIQVVGVVADEKQDGLDQPVQPTAYSSIVQHMQNPLTYVVRSTQNAANVLSSARRVVSSVDKDLALTNVATLQEVVDASLEGHRFRTALLTAFAAIALLLAALGIYGVLAYSVSQRSRELGVRLALGAAPTALVRLVVAQAMRPVAAGAIVGIVASAGVTRVMQSLLFNVQALDLFAYAAGALALTLIAAAACAVPAVRASRVDPVIVLRDE